jgi:hypothetical protein
MYSIFFLYDFLIRKTLRLISNPTEGVLEIRGDQRIKDMYGIRLDEDSSCEYLEFIRHLFVIPTLVKVESTCYGSSFAKLLKHCLSLTNKFTELRIPIVMDMVTLSIYNYCADL